MRGTTSVVASCPLPAAKVTFGLPVTTTAVAASRWGGTVELLPASPSENAQVTIEATAYFVVAEAVTNITKHARARSAAVEVDFTDGALRVVVEDDGRGGARLEPAGGLAGLAARVASVDGTFRLNSPEGGPTRVEAVIPCAL